MTNETFTATNGITFTFPEDSSVRWEQGHPPRFVTTALREYFQHERDRELGRWRDPETGLLVYRSDGYAIVISEKTLVRNSYLRTDLGHPLFSPTSNDYNRAAARYFAAHPEPKPWHSAEPGEVWLLDIDDEQAPAITFLDKNTGQTLFATPTFTDLEPVSPLITAGRKLWPEESDDE